MSMQWLVAYTEELRDGVDALFYTAAINGVFAFHLGRPCCLRKRCDIRVAESVVLYHHHTGDL